MLRRLRKRQSYAVTSKEIRSGDTNRNVFQSIDRLMREDEARMRSTFATIVPFVNEIFHALANYDVRFEFDEISFDGCGCEKASENEYNLLCSLKELPNEEDLRIEGKESDGALTLRLSTGYKESFEKACWEDICLPANAHGYRFFSTKKLLKVLIDSVKHAIEDVTATDSSSRSAKCKLSKCKILLEVKVEGKCLSFNLLPCIQMDEKTMKMVALDEKIKKISKHLKMSNTEYAYLVAKPVLDSEELWRITVNNIENKLLNKVTAVTQCGAHSLFAVNLLNERYFAAGKVSALLPFCYVRLALLTEFLKFPHGNYWQKACFMERVESVLRSLETHLDKGELKNIYTGVNILGRREGESLAELSRDVGLLRSQFRKFLLNFTK